MPIINTITRPPKLTRKTRTAAYARVSSGKDAMLHSLSAQVSYYSSLIQNNPEWIYAGVYADEALTGTKDARDNFQRLLADCRDGQIDLVIVKSISRFARNTVTLLQSVRELKSLGVDVYFEEQNIHTMSAEGELMLTILASYAQEESRSVSENQKWRIKKNFENGLTWNATTLGYRPKNGVLEIVPEEAAIVRRIFTEYLSGKGCLLIAKGLNEDGITNRNGNPWNDGNVRKILGNYNYTGNLLLQKTFRDNHITKRTCRNRGELPQYHAEETHEAIIDIDTFNAVQAEIARRAERFKTKAPKKPKHPFTSLLVCETCGASYRRKTTHSGVVWICTTYNTKGKAACPSKAIPESTLAQVTAMVTQDLGAVDHIKVCSGNRLVFIFKDGRTEERRWKDRSRSESWTPEMRARAGRQTRERRSEQCLK